MIVYLVECAVNGKEYVGQTKHSIDRRWAGHRRRDGSGSGLLSKAIRKHGEASFKRTVLIEVPTREAAHELERRLIERFDCRAPRGYNLSGGGDGGGDVHPDTIAKLRAYRHTAEARAKRRAYRHTAEARAKIAAAGRGRKVSDATRAARSQAMSGRTLSQRTIAKRTATRRERDGYKAKPESEARRIAKMRSPEVRAKISATKRGTKLSPEHRAKIAAANRRRWARATPEDRAVHAAKISATKRRRKGDR